MRKIAMLLVTIFAVATVNGQFNPKEQLPSDSNIRTGKLPNGLTYYIRHNEKPKNRCEFHIAQDVGAIIEEDNENGLAHFLEHLCFNGTEHFPGKNIINYFESIGVSFGGGINASTSLDKTQYHLSDVPTTREEILDSALLVLRDWSCGVLLQDEEIEKERGVILEEWRTGNNASKRMWFKRQQMMMPGSQYAKRNVIGDTAIIKNFKPQTLRDFYHKWYGPDLQAIVVVGDIDVDKMEQKIIALFSPIKPREGMTPRPRFGALDNEKPITSVYLDPEAQSQEIRIDFKHPHNSKKYNGTYAAYDGRIKRSLIASCLNTRLKEKYGMDSWLNFFPIMSCGYYNLAGETDVFEISVEPDNGKEMELYRSMCIELERIRRYGILEEELELAKKEELASLERYQKTYKNIGNSSYAYDCITHFMTNRGLITPEFEIDFYQKHISNVTAEELNKMIAGFFNADDRNMFIVATGKAAPNENGMGCSECHMPTEEELLALYIAAKDSVIEKPTFTKKECKLVKKEPKAGKIVKKIYNNESEATEITLSNNVKVIVKPTDVDANNIDLEAYSKGGMALLPKKDLINASYVGEIIRRNGVGDLTPLEQDKMLAGKQVGISGTFISDYCEYLGAYSATADFDIMLQLVYLTFTAPRKDDKLFNDYMEQRKSDLTSRMSQPNYEFSRRVNKEMYGHCDRYYSIDTNTIKQIDQVKALKLYKERFGNPADFTFYIVGDLDINDSATLASIEKWLGGMKTNNKFDTIVDNKMDIARGLHYVYDKHAMETDKATNGLLITGFGFEFSLKNIVICDLIGNILSTRYLESIREKEGGSYGVSASCRISKYYSPEVSLGIRFDTDPDKQNRLLNIVYDEIEKIIAEGPLANDLAKEKEILLNNYEEDLERIGGIQNNLGDYYKNGINMKRDYVNTVNSITGEDIQKMLKELYEQKNIFETVLMPAR